MVNRDADAIRWPRFGNLLRNALEYGPFEEALWVTIVNRLREGPLVVSFFRGHW
jgi:hypothetical protein